MRKGQLKAIAATALHTAKGVPYRYKKDHTPTSITTILTHADDELGGGIHALYQRASQKDNLTIQPILATNGSHGEHTGPTQKYTEVRYQELIESLQIAGYKKGVARPLLDEKTLYRQLVNHHFEQMAADVKPFIFFIEQAMEYSDAVFVNDFGGYHIIHDTINYLTCRTAKRNNFTHVIEYWQPYLNAQGLSPDEIKEKLKNGDATEIVGMLTPNDKHKILRKRGYAFDLLPFGIKKGRTFLSIKELQTTLRALKVYSSQEDTLSRFEKISVIDERLSAPHFRQVDVKNITYDRPRNGVFYEHAEHRKRDLPRIPTFDDFTLMVKSLDELLFE